MRERSRPPTQDDNQEYSVLDLAGRLTGDHHLARHPLPLPHDAPRGSRGTAASGSPSAGGDEPAEADVWSSSWGGEAAAGPGGSLASSSLAASAAGSIGGSIRVHSTRPPVGPVSNVVEEHLSVQRAKDVFQKAVNDSMATSSSAGGGGGASFTSGGGGGGRRSFRGRASEAGAPESSAPATCVEPASSSPRMASEPSGTEAESSPALLLSDPVEDGPLCEEVGAGGVPRVTATEPCHVTASPMDSVADLNPDHHPVSQPMIAPPPLAPLPAVADLLGDLFGSPPEATPTLLTQPPFSVSTSNVTAIAGSAPLPVDDLLGSWDKDLLDPPPQAAAPSPLVTAVPSASVASPGDPPRSLAGRAEDEELPQHQEAAGISPELRVEDGFAGLGGLADDDLAVLLDPEPTVALLRDASDLHPAAYPEVDDDAATSCRADRPTWEASETVLPGDGLRHSNGQASRSDELRQQEEGENGAAMAGISREEVAREAGMSKSPEGRSQQPALEVIAKAIALEDEAVEDEAVKDEAVEDEAVEDEAVRDEPVEDEAVEDEAVRDE